MLHILKKLTRIDARLVGVAVVPTVAVGVAIADGALQDCTDYDPENNSCRACSACYYSENGDEQCGVEEASSGECPDGSKPHCWVTTDGNGHSLYHAECQWIAGT